MHNTVMKWWPLVTLALAIVVQAEKLEDPMLAEESVMLDRYAYSSKHQIPKSFMTYMQQKTSPAASPMVATSLSAPEPFHRKYSVEPTDFYKRSASEYYNSASGPMDDGYHGMFDSYQSPNHLPPPPPQVYPMSSSGGGYGDDPGGYSKGKEITVAPDHKPITLHYRTHAQPIVVHQTRIPGPKPEVKHTKTHEEPHRVVHEVIRPIIQEVHEIIQPYRRVVQQVQPVIEEVRTVIAREAGKNGAAGAGGHGGGGGGGGFAGGAGGYGGGHGMVAHADYESRKYGGALQMSHHMPKMYRKAAVYEGNESQSSYESMPLVPAQAKIARSKVFINKKGVPVYQSQYMGPVYMSS